MIDTVPYLPTTCRRSQHVSLEHEYHFREALGEERLFGPAFNWLTQTRRLSTSASVVRELPWCGRHVDVAVLLGRGRTLAVEMKLRNVRRAVGQAVRNALAFDESWAFVSATPSVETLGMAAEVGVGIVHLRDDGTTSMLIKPQRMQVDPRIRRALGAAIREKAVL